MAALYPRQYCVIAILILLVLLSRNNDVAEGFITPPSSIQYPHQHCSVVVLSSSSTPLDVIERDDKTAIPNDNEPQEDDTSSDDNNIISITAEEAKQNLLKMIPQMTGTEEEYSLIQSYVNLLEEQYSPIQTIDFLNLAIMGEWQLLFSTNVMPIPRKNLRLRELIQNIQPNEEERRNGTVVNTATWDYYAQDDNDDDSTNQQQPFNTNGNFNIKCSYSIIQGARMVCSLIEHEIRPSKSTSSKTIQSTSSKTIQSKDVPKLVGLLHRSIPAEIFDPNNHAADCTYLDTDIRIVRMTGDKHEGVRNIWMRKGSLEISAPSGLV